MVIAIALELKSLVRAGGSAPIARRLKLARQIPGLEAWHALCWVNGALSASYKGFRLLPEHR